MGASESKEQEIVKMMEESIYVKRILEARNKLTGWERVQLIFKKDEFGKVSPELDRIILASTLGLVVGAIMGGLGRGRIAYQSFLRSNAHEIFETPLEAKRKLQDTVTLGMGAGGYRVGWRMGLFTGMYMTVATTVGAYRGEMGVIDQVAGGTAAGFVYKLPMGPKASIAGAVTGTLLGLFAGGITYGLTRLTGQTIDSVNLRYYYEQAKKEQKKHMNIGVEREILHKYDQMPYQESDYAETRFHDQLLAHTLFGKDNEKGAKKEAKSEDSTKTSQNKVVSEVPSENVPSNKSDSSTRNT